MSLLHSATCTSDVSFGYIADIPQSDFTNAETLHFMGAAILRVLSREVTLAYNLFQLYTNNCRNMTKAIRDAF